MNPLPSFHYGGWRRRTWPWPWCHGHESPTRPGQLSPACSEASANQLGLTKMPGTEAPCWFDAYTMASMKNHQPAPKSSPEIPGPYFGALCIGRSKSHRFRAREDKHAIALHRGPERCNTSQGLCAEGSRIVICWARLIPDRSG